MIKTEVESHAPEDQGLGRRLIDRIRQSADGSSEDNAPSEPRQYSGSRKKEREEMATLITTGLVVIVTAINIPEPIQPNRDELSVVSNHLTSILVRHNLLLGKLSGDALDVVGIIAVGASYYARVGPELRRMRGDGGHGGPGRGPRPEGPDSPPPAEGVPEIHSPISDVDAASGSWLENALRQGQSE